LPKYRSALEIIVALISLEQNYSKSISGISSVEMGGRCLGVGVATPVY